MKHSFILRRILAVGRLPLAIMICVCFAEAADVGVIVCFVGNVVAAVCCMDVLLSNGHNAGP